MAVNYQQLNVELDEILEKLQDPAVQVDQALELYQAGLARVAQLEKYLKSAENTLAKLKLDQPGKA